MKSITIDEKQARELYPDATAKLKAFLETNFGGKQFFETNITDQVKTFEDACKILGVVPDEHFNKLDEYNQASIKLQTIIKALNEGWKPNWNDENEYKYYPWWRMDSVLGFGLGDVYCLGSYSDVGSRLCFKSEELAQYAAKQFKDLYKILMTNI
jgi:hypothetical protein